MTLPDPAPSSAALVTGASAGIGAAIARELAQRGHGLILVARRRQRLDDLAAELRDAHGVRVETISCDLGKPAPRARLAGRIAELGLDVEILVNNAGFATHGPFHEADPARELEQVRVLVEAVVALTSAFVPAMVERRRGAVLNVASTAAMQPLPYSAGYSAAKAYVLTFSEALHQEVRGRGVNVTALCPGPVATDFWEISNWDLTGKAPGASRLRQRYITPEEAARAGIAGVAAGRRVVVPDVAVRAFTESTRLIPHVLKLPVIERAMRPRRRQD